MLTAVSAVIIIWITFILFTMYKKSTNAILLCESKRRLDGKTAIVTGGTAGMGLEVAKDFAERGARVIVACPFGDEGARAETYLKETTDNDNVVFKMLDLGSLTSTRKFAYDILKNEDRLDILVNNAGVLGPLKMSEDNLNFIMQVNYFGTYLLTLLLLPLLKKSGKPGDPSRIVNVASLIHPIGKVDIAKFNRLQDPIKIQTYANSKLCLLLFGHELSKRMEGWNVVVNSVDPGMTVTNIYVLPNKHVDRVLKLLFASLFKTPKEGAQTTIHVSVDKRAGEVSGRYFKNCQLSAAASKARDDEVASKLWEETARIVNISGHEQELCFKE